MGLSLERKNVPAIIRSIDLNRPVRVNGYCLDLSEHICDNLDDMKFFLMIFLILVNTYHSILRGH